MLTRWLRTAASQRRLVERARIILWAAQGQNAVEIARRLGTRPGRVSKWRQRFARDRLARLAARDGQGFCYLARKLSRAFSAATRSGKPRRYAARFAGCGECTKPAFYEAGRTLTVRPL